MIGVRLNGFAARNGNQEKSPAPVTYFALSTRPLPKIKSFAPISPFPHNTYGMKARPPCLLEVLLAGRCASCPPIGARACKRDGANARACALRGAPRCPTKLDYEHQRHIVI